MRKIQAVLSSTLVRRFRPTQATYQVITMRTIIRSDSTVKTGLAMALTVPAVAASIPARFPTTSEAALAAIDTSGRERAETTGKTTERLVTRALRSPNRGANRHAERPERIGTREERGQDNAGISIREYCIIEGNRQVSRNRGARDGFPRRNDDARTAASGALPMFKAAWQP